MIVHYEKDRSYKTVKQRTTEQLQKEVRAMKRVRVKAVGRYVSEASLRASRLGRIKESF